jgi:hypothetical protein
MLWYGLHLVHTWHNSKVMLFIKQTQVKITSSVVSVINLSSFVFTHCLCYCYTGNRRLLDMRPATPAPTAGRCRR